MKMKTFVLLLILLAAFWGCVTQEPIIIEPVATAKSITEQATRATLSDGNLETRLTELTNQIIDSLIETKRSRIAVVEFSDLHGNVTEFGKYLSEELITRLFMTHRFEVIERQLLNKVIKEHELTLSGLVEETSAKKLGKILGVDSIASGSVADLHKSVKVNARLISTETGSIFAVAAVEILKDETVSRLLAKKPTQERLSFERTRLVKLEAKEKYKRAGYVWEDGVLRITVESLEKTAQNTVTMKVLFQNISDRTILVGVHAGKSHMLDEHGNRWDFRGWDTAEIKQGRNILSGKKVRSKISFRTRTQGTDYGGNIFDLFLISRSRSHGFNIHIENIKAH